jgi:hypothetical protein
MSSQRAALAYARRGWPVFPLRPNNKEPHPVLAPHGLKDATTDHHVIEAWWDRVPSANVAIVTGSASGLVVVDLDLGADAKELELPSTRVIQTPSGGVHLYYRHPGREVRNSAGRLAAKVDVRGDGGYVVAPPSRVSGKPYALINKRLRLAPFPSDLLELLTDETNGRARPGHSEQISRGDRHKRLVSLAGSLRYHGLEAELIEEVLLKFNEAKCEPPKPPKEVRRLARDIAERYSPAADDTAVTLSLDDIAERTVEWIWPGRIPRGKITILDGDPELGKSALTFDVIARLSKGERLPDGALTEPVTVLIMSSEDDIADTIKPRLRAAGARFQNVHTIALRRDADGNRIPFTIPDDLTRLERALDETRAGLALLDPIMGFASEDIQTHNDASIRRMLGPLADVASERGCAILGIRHLKKDQREQNPLYRGGGSIAIGGAARSVLLVGKMPNDDTERKRVLAPVKNNLARRSDVRSLAFEVESWEEDEAIPVVTWLGETPVTAEELLSRPDNRTTAPARAEAEEVIREVLADGPMRSKVFEAELKAAGIKSDTARAARERIDVHSWRERNDDGTTSGWFVHLPEQPCPPGCRRVFVKGRPT